MYYVACVYLLQCNVASCRLAVVARRTRRGFRNPFEWPRIYALRRKIQSAEKKVSLFAYLVLQSVSYPSQNTPRQESFLSFLDALLGHDHNCPSHGEKCLLPSYAIQPVSSTQGGRGYAWKTQYHHHHAVVWDIRKRSKRGEGGENGKMEAKSFLCQAAVVASRHRCMWDIRAF